MREASITEHASEQIWIHGKRIIAAEAHRCRDRNVVAGVSGGVV
jgi:hypothetical protein